METLLLNADYRPCAVLTWKDAISLIFREAVHVLVEYEDKTVRSSSVEYRVPSVIVLRSYVRRGKHVKFSRSNIYMRDNFTCLYCGVTARSGKVKVSELTFDHVMPKTLGGLTSWENIVTACSVCNHKKGGRTPEQAKMPLLRQPYMPKHLNDVEFYLQRKRFPDAWKDFLGHTTLSQKTG